MDAIKVQANAAMQGFEAIPTHERLLSIAKANNIEVLEADLFDISGALRKEGDVWRIYVNRQDSPQRKRFTIAHELGHFFLHTTEGTEFVDGYVFTRSDIIRYGERELEANEFAGNLVMPESKVRELVTGAITDETIVSLARTFEVSPFAMETRLKNLGLINGPASSTPRPHTP
ncbi:ImmA/IrrE family metallo-endopeptidase [Candidatus Peregrinibacteria bacterium]|nr:ImmA/IrrE family metallo-endopeptidase [Candidatus Peregrinibacteria bacterium]